MAHRLLFLHGLESGPGGFKAEHMRRNPRYELNAPQLPTAEAIAFLAETGGVLPDQIRSSISTVARAAIDAARPDVLVGSSFGGGIAMELAALGYYDGPLVLLAPAGNRLFGVTQLPPRSGRVAVIHGRRDDVVPKEDSVAFTSASACDVLLWLTNDDHRLKESVVAGFMDEAIAWVLHHQEAIASHSK